MPLMPLNMRMMPMMPMIGMKLKQSNIEPIAAKTLLVIKVSLIRLTCKKALILA